MASSHVPTGTITNLTRLELEALRKAEAATQGRAVTKGDDGTITGGVGVGNILREPFKSGPSVHLDEVYALTPPSAPGGGLGTTTQVSAIPSETVQWFGPTYITDGTGATFGATSLTDTSIVLDFAAAGVLAGDYVLIKPSAELSGIGLNAYAIATVQTTPLPAATSLTLNNILRTDAATTLDADGKVYSYVIVRRAASRLFALPGSGPVGGEQTFLFVRPDSTLHTQANPSLTAIETDRITNVVSPFYSAATADRADAVFASTRRTTNKIGYRVVFYPDNGAGAPDFTKPILTATPKINTSLASTEQRMSIDYRAGVLRLSCAPNSGSDINPAGVFSAQGRVNLWAIFWAFDQSITMGSARGLFVQRSTEPAVFTPARIRFDATRNVWLVGATTEDNEFYVKALATAEDAALGAEFGTHDFFGPVLKPRYFRYERSSNTWTMRATGDQFDADSFGEVELGGRTKLTVGDGSAPRQAPGDFNPTFTLASIPSAIGTRSTREPIIAALDASVSGTQATVHLRKGRYYTSMEIPVPPGTTIEGDGPTTRVFTKKGLDGLAPSIFKVGPNTPWGVYDASYVPSGMLTYTPTQFNLASMQKIEGFDVVWNPTRRVWAVVQADCTNNAVWLNEIRLDGTPVHAGLGFDVKNDGRELFSSSMPGGENHTNAHYPRIAYHEGQDEYAIVWVEKHPGLNGPVCKLQVIEVTDNDPVTFTRRFTTLAQAKMVGAGDFADHPSVAVDNSNPDDGYAVAVSYWSYSGGLATTEAWTSLYDSTTLADFDVATAVLTTQHIVSSTDVAEDNAGGFLFTWSERNHPIITSMTGDVTIGLFTDGPFTGVTQFPAAGVEAGDRFLYLGSALINGGYDGLVQVVNPFDLTIVRDDGSPFPDTGGNPLEWAIPPRVEVKARRFYAGGTTGAVKSVISQNPLAATYRLDVREPDFVRLSRGGNNWLLVYQAFDSTSFLATPSTNNFDNGFDVTLIDNAGLPLKDLSPYREHLATCSLLLGDSGDPANLAGENITVVSPEHQARDLNVSARSLGGRDPMLVVPNGPANQTSPQRLISARNFFHRWSNGESHSLIPDVTWTGQDWVVVSPSQTEIHSYTGKFHAVAGPTYYVSDATFYFGQDTMMSTGRFLRRTVDTDDKIFFPTLNLLVNIEAVVTEHSVLVTVVSGPPPGTTAGLEWVLIRDSLVGNIPGGIKNPGFRVSAEGRLLSGTVYTTFADEVNPDDIYSLPRRTELMFRKNTSGLNANATLAEGYNDPAFAQSAIWGDVSFRGVAVGAPKGCGTANATLRESPKVAIAWGETMYGCIDRELRGHTTLTNRTNFFRQSFGPYRVTFRNLALYGAVDKSDSATNGLKMLSQQHVFTRHGHPATSSGGFATDGYRNCFVAPVVQKFDATDATITKYASTIQAYYTDAIGADPIGYRGPSTQEIPEYGLYSDFMPDLLLAQPNPVGAPADQVVARSKPSSPVVICDGKRFVAAWTESNSPASIISTTDGILYGLVCLGAFPGDEDQFFQDRLIAPDDDFRQKVTEFAVISTGSRNELCPSRSVFAADIAHSGRTYAVIWTGGQNPSDGAEGGIVPNLGGSAIGVTIFNGTGATSGGNTFMIATDVARGHYQDAKIVWDGKQYVAVWRQENAGSGQIMSTVIPENGFGTNVQTLKTAGGIYTTEGLASERGIGGAIGGGGVEANVSFPNDAVIDISANPTPVKPGDLVHIDYIEPKTAPGTRNFQYAGWYVVKDYDPVLSRIYLHYDRDGGARPRPFTDMPVGTNLVVGMITSGSQGARTSLQRFDANANQPPTGSLTGPQPLVVNPWGNPDGLLLDTDRIDGLVYNEVDDEYAVLLRKMSTSTMTIATWKRGTYQATPDKTVVSSVLSFCGSLAWNGRHYLVVCNNMVNGDVLWTLVTPKLSVEATGVIASAATVIGSSVNQIPGPGYGALRGSALIQPRMRDVKAIWNNRLNRWVVSGSYLWYQERALHATETQIWAIQGGTPALDLIPGGYTGRTVTLDPAAANLAQVGCRLIGVRPNGGGGWTNMFSPTVMGIDVTGKILTIDTTDAEAGGTVLADWGVPLSGNYHSIGVVTREDVFCWTLGYSSPTVKLFDADDVAFENVEFASGYVDIEERYRNLTRPMFQNGGLAFGNPSMSGMPTNHVNHIFLKPEAKTPTTTFANVRSVTMARHALGDKK